VDEMQKGTPGHFFGAVAEKHGTVWTDVGKNALLIDSA